MRRPSIKRCRFCGKGTACVIDTRAARVGDTPSTRRRYRCTDCPARWTTYEIPAEVADELAQDAVSNLLVTLEKAVALAQGLAALSDRMDFRRGDARPR